MPASRTVAAGDGKRHRLDADNLHGSGLFFVAIRGLAAKVLGDAVDMVRVITLRVQPQHKRDASAVPRARRWRQTVVDYFFAAAGAAAGLPVRYVGFMNCASPHSAYLLRKSR